MSNKQEKPDYPHIIANWRLGRKLGAGFSGAIFLAQNVHTQKVVALKLQLRNESCPTNRYERHFYPALQGGTGMPTLWASGVEGPWDFLGMDLLGSSLDSLHRMLIRQQDVWDLRSVCCIAIQVIDRLRFMHSRGILHRDIQLGNCVLGLPPNDKTIYMIDFGFSKFYMDQRTRRHIPDSKEPRDFIGNYWFSSVRVHCNYQVPSRRDDLEALILMLIHLLTPGGLSWTRNGVPKTEEEHDYLIYLKRTARPEDLCRGLPPVFEDMLRYCRKLAFMATPDYGQWIDEFRDLAEEHGFEDIDFFIWPSPYPQPSVRVTSAPKPTARRELPEMERVLNGLANMQLGCERQVLGERPDHVNVDRESPVQADAKKGKGKQKRPSGDAQAHPPSESDEENAHARARAAQGTAGRVNKAARLAQLAREMRAVADNAGLARLVREFVAVMQGNTSKMLTREGFAVLDALHKQLADPSVFVATVRSQAHEQVEEEGTEGGTERETRQGKMNKLWRLGTDVQAAGSNAQLVRMVAEFGAVISRSSGRTVTKDGFRFLNGLAMRIEALS